LSIPRLWKPVKTVRTGRPTICATEIKAAQALIIGRIYPHKAKSNFFVPAPKEQLAPLNSAGANAANALKRRFHS